MSSSKSQASAGLARMSGDQAKKTYDVGFGGLRAQQDLLRTAEA